MGVASAWGVALWLATLTGCSKAPSPAAGGADVDSTTLTSELERHRERNVRTLAALADAGSDLSAPHALEHHFLCSTRDAASNVIAWGAASGYRASAVMENDELGRRHFYFDLIRDSLPTLEEITRQTTAMLDAARRNDAEYDGWGCAVVSK